MLFNPLSEHNFGDKSEVSDQQRGGRIKYFSKLIEASMYFLEKKIDGQTKGGETAVK
jgi:hypothetical protein